VASSLIGVAVGILASSSIYVGRPVIESYSPNSEITFMGPMLAATFGFTTFFKSIHAAMGTYPEGADSDLKTWLLWFVMTPEPTFAKGKTIKASRKEILAKVRYFLLKIIALFLLLTVLMIYPPPYERVTTERSLSREDYGDIDIDIDGVFAGLLRTHVRGFFYLWILSSFISFCLDFSTITNYFLSGGVRMEPGFCNPLLESRSFKETWGTRWNRPVNVLLKRSVYIPSRKSGLSPKASAVLTFFASGLLHEYNFLTHNDRSVIRPGEITMFFLLMGALMIAESIVWDRCPGRLQDTIERLPSAVTASFLTLMVSGVAERCFLRPWIRSGFFEAVAEMMVYLDCR